MSMNDMTNEQFNTIIDSISRMDRRFDRMDQRIDNIEKHMVTKSDVNVAVFQGVAFAAACIVGTVVVLNSVGAL